MCFTLNTTVLLAIPAVWVSNAPALNTLHLLADSWLLKSEFSAIMLPYLLGNTVNLKHFPLCRHIATLPPKGSPLWNDTRSVTPQNDAQQHARNALWRGRWGMTNVCERFLSKGLFIGWQMRQGQENRPHQSALAFVYDWTLGAGEHEGVMYCNVNLLQWVCVSLNVY